MSGFTKLFSSIVTSTIWREQPHIKVVWITMLAIADRHGAVEGSVPGLADLARVTLEECVEALEKFKAPDPWSRTKEHEGRRIEEIDGGWRILNYTRHRDRTGVQDDEVSMTPEAIRKRRQRERDRAGDTRDNVTDRDIPVTASASASDSGSVVGEEVQEKGVRDTYEYATRLAVAANKGLGCEIPRIMASSGSTFQVAEILRGADIPIEFAEQAVLDAASRSRQKESIRSLSYFTRAVVEAWERDGLAKQVLGSKLRARILGETPLARIAFEGQCPRCEARVRYEEWQTHFRTQHPREDVPNFTDHRAPDAH